MNYFKINGVERAPPVGMDQNFDSLLGFINKTMVNETTLISAVRVNGVEINQNEEEALAGVPLTELDSVDICFAHPREIAEDTLQTLRLFTDNLIALSRSTAASIGTEESNAEFQRLMDGIQTLADTVINVRKILRIGILAPVNVLEAELLSTLKDLVETHHSKDLTYRIALLNQHLPENLAQWRDEGIPAMIRSRDS